MSMDERIVAVFEDFQSGRLTRRQFGRRLAAAGFAGSAIAAFLAACGGSTSPTVTPAKGATSAPAASVATSAPIPTPAPAPTSAPAPTAAAGSAAAPSTGAGAATDLGILKSPDPNPKRGGTLRIAFGVTTSNYDLQQGANTNRPVPACTATSSASISSTA